MWFYAGYTHSEDGTCLYEKVYWSQNLGKKLVGNMQNKNVKHS